MWVQGVILSLRRDFRRIFWESSRYTVRSCSGYTVLSSIRKREAMVITLLLSTSITSEYYFVGIHFNAFHYWSCFYHNYICSIDKCPDDQEDSSSWGRTIRRTPQAPVQMHQLPGDCNSYPKSIHNPTAPPKCPAPHCTMWPISAQY